MAYPTDRTYAESHEWHKVDGDVVTVGITRFAVDQLTDVTFCEMKPAGTRVEAGGVVGEVESVKTTSDIYCACAGEIIEVNGEVASNPSILNEDPYERGWLVRVRIADRSGLDGLMDSSAYGQHAG